jgi:two-component sensor histidine kinase
LEGTDIRLVYRNDGPDYPEEVLDGKRHSVGLGIVDRVTRHSLRGRWTIRNDGGAVTDIRFPADNGLYR